MSEIPQRAAGPTVWAVVVGYNHVADTLDCLQSLAQNRYAPLRLVFVDNGSADDSAAQVRAAHPTADVLRIEQNAGPAGGFNTGIAHALAQGADYVLMLNNDTLLAPDMVAQLVATAEANPTAGLVTPKIFYHAHPDRIWSAGSRFRRFPPVVVMQKTHGPDDGRFDRQPELAFTTFCAVLFRRRLLLEIGLLDPSYFLFYEDYDYCLRARAAGYGIRLAPAARLWHKVSLSTEAGKPNPGFWFNYGRSEAIFARRHGRQQPWLTGRLHRLYLLLRMVAEGQAYGLKPFTQGLQAGRTAELTPPPSWKKAAGAGGL